MSARSISGLALTVAFIVAVPCHADTPDAVLRGTFVAPRGAHMKHLRAHVQTSAADDATVDCEVSPPSWKCEVPAGKLDLELYSPGLAPAYLWNVNAVSGASLDLGEVTLTYGAPVTGKIVDRNYGAKGVNVELVPTGALTGDAALRSRLKSRHTMSNRSGDYAFSDVPAGTYNLVASKDGYSTVTRTNIHVESGRDQKLPRIAIAELVRLAVYTTPPLDFYGNAWLVRLNKGVQGTPYEQLSRAGKCSRAGAWSANLLDAGTYRLEILSSHGERVASKYVDIDGAANLDIHIDSIPIQGKLRIGDRPVKGLVSLIWEDGSSLTFRTSAEGDFTGILTHEGAWRATVRTASPRMELHLSDIQVRRRDDEERATVRIDLPPGEIHGSVVDEDEQPLHASVMLFRGGALIATTATADDGTFSFAGLENGAIQFNATAKGFSSGYTPAAIDEDHASPVKLVLHSLETIRGHVLDPAGNPILGATVRYASAGQAAGQTATGLSGDFAIPVPKHGGIAEVAIIAPGFPRKFMTLRAPESGVDPPELRVTVGGVSGRLDVDISKSDTPWPSITSGGVLILPLFELFLPRPGGPPAELRSGGYTFDVEPGTYTICGSGTLSSRCVTKTIAATGVATFTNPSGQQWQ